MANRQAVSAMWGRDWYLSLTGQQQLFVHYLRDHCDCAGIWQPAFKQFEQASGFRINKADFLTAVNSGEKTRVMVLNSPTRGELWWITGFIEDQLGTRILSPENKFAKGIIRQLENNQVPYFSIGYILDPSRGFKGLQGASRLLKEKEKEKGGMGGIFAELAEKLASKIMAADSRVQISESVRHTWEPAIEKIIRIDGRTETEIEDAINNLPAWVKSAAALRKAIKDNRIKPEQPQDPAKTAQAKILYEAYPNKIGEFAAIPAIVAALGCDTYENILAGVQRYAESVKGQEPKYIQSPEKWFKAGRWKDRPAEQPRSPAADNRAKFEFERGVQEKYKNVKVVR